MKAFFLALILLAAGCRQEPELEAPGPVNKDLPWREYAIVRAYSPADLETAVNKLGWQWQLVGGVGHSGTSGIWYQAASKGWQ